MSLNIDIQGNLLPNILTMLTQLLATLIIFLLFKKFLWKPVREILAKRTASMQSEINEAKKIHEEASAQLEEAKKEIEEARVSSRKIVEEARQEAGSLRDSILKDAERKARNKMDEANAKISQREREVRESLKEETVKVAMEAVAKLLDERSGEKDDLAALEKYIEQESRDNA